MTNFSDKDIDRLWTQKELLNLSQKELTRLTFRKNAKNLVFFGSGAAVVTYLAANLGTIGNVIGWVAVVVYALFALEPLFAFMTTTISLFAPVSDKGWMIAQLAITGVSTLFFLAFAALICINVTGLNISDFMPRGE